MKKMETLQYEAPEVEIIEVEVEKGFANTNGDGGAGGEDMGDLQ